MTAQNTNSDTLISLVWGKQVFDRSQMKVHAFAYDNTGNTVFVNKKLDQVQRLQKHLASTDGYEEHGAWYTESIKSENGVLLLLRCSSSRNGSPYSQAGVFLELNNHAPLFQVSVALPPHRLALQDSVNAFIGNAFILTPEEVEDRGYVVKRSLVSNFFEQDEIDELISVTEILPGASKPELTEVVDSDGKVKNVLIPAKPKRKLRMRKK